MTRMHVEAAVDRIRMAGNKPKHAGKSQGTSAKGKAHRKKPMHVGRQQVRFWPTMILTPVLLDMLSRGGGWQNLGGGQFVAAPKLISSFFFF